MAVGIGVGLLAGAAALAVIRAWPGSLSARALAWAGLLSPVFFALHEAGHVLGFRLTGMQLSVFAVGPVLARREGGRLRWGFNRVLASWGGIAGALPPDGVSSERLAARLTWVIACGPLANVAAGTVAWILAASFARSGAAPLLQASAFINLALAFGTAFPFPVGGRHDGARLLRLLRGGAIRRAEAARLVVEGAFRRGVAPREWPAAEVAAMTVHPAHGTFAALSHALAYYHAVDSDQIAQAARHLQRWIDLAASEGAQFRFNASLEAAYFEARYGAGAAAGRAWLGRVPDMPPKFDVARCRPEAAVLAAEGNRAGAAERLARVRRSSGEPLPPHEVALLDRLAAELEAAADRPADLSGGSGTSPLEVS
jgi:hypothetical protein